MKDEYMNRINNNKKEKHIQNIILPWSFKVLFADFGNNNDTEIFHPTPEVY